MLSLRRALPIIILLLAIPIVAQTTSTITGTETAAGSYDLTIAGELSLHGVVKPFTVPVHLEQRGDGLTASGKMVVKQTDFGIEPTTAAASPIAIWSFVRLTWREYMARQSTVRRRTSHIRAI